MTRYRAFSLVEMLAVLAVVSVLAAMLLPAVERSLELARRTQCANNIRQHYLAAMEYAAMFNNNLPGPGKAVADPGVNTEDQCATYNSDGAGGYYHTAWHQLLFGLQLFPMELVQCPSMDIPAAVTPYSNTSRNSLHYAYRYNSLRAVGHVTSRLTRREFWDESNSKQPLFDDAHAYRRYNINPVFPIVERSTGTFLQPNVNAKWAHISGGNIIDHRGALRFMPPLIFSTAQAEYSWPTGGFPMFMLFRSDTKAYFDRP